MGSVVFGTPSFRRLKCFVLLSNTKMSKAKRSRSIPTFSSDVCDCVIGICQKLYSNVGASLFFFVSAICCESVSYSTEPYNISGDGRSAPVIMAANAPHLLLAFFSPLSIPWTYSFFPDTCVTVCRCTHVYIHLSMLHFFFLRFFRCLCVCAQSCMLEVERYKVLKRMMEGEALVVS